MKTLILETATPACSVALVEDGVVLARAHEVVGRGHAERLLPMVAELPGGGRADRILVDCGPGSFTGVRVGIAAGLGLALGWGAQAHGFTSMALVAAAHFAVNPQLDALAVVLEGGHGEVFMQGFVASPFAPDGALASRTPEAAIAALAGRVAVGSGAARLLALDSTLPATSTLPDAAHAILLPAAETGLPPVPIYGRAPDAKPQAVAA